MADNMIDRELGWDDEIQHDSTYTLLPDGDYPFVVTAMERARFAGSSKLPPCNMAVLTLTVDGGPHGQTNLTHRLYLHSKTEGLLCAFFTAIGLRKPGEALRMDWTRVVGARGFCTLEQHTYTKRNGEEGTSNQVKRWLEPPEPKAAPGPSWTQGAF